MDLKKEIKLSDLMPKGKRGSGKAPKAKAPRKRAAVPSELVGLKIGATGLAAAQIVNNGGKQLIRVAQGRLAPGIVDRGEVRDPAALGQALDEFFSANKLPRRGIRIGLANSRIGVRVIEVPDLDDPGRLENAIRFRASEVLSVPTDEAVLDYHLLDLGEDEGGNVVRRILLVVAYTDSIDRYLAATDAAKLDVAGIDLEAFALLRALAQPAPVDDDGTQPTAVIAVSVGHDRTTLAISDGHVCQFTRVLEWGGENVGLALARALKISPSEAEELKHGLAFVDGDATLDDVEPDDVPVALEAVRHEFQALVRELLSSLRFYQAQPSSLPIGRILVSGGVANIPGFAEELTRELGVPAELADPLGRVSLRDGIELPEELGGLTIAVGLGIED